MEWAMRKLLQQLRPAWKQPRMGRWKPNNCLLLLQMLSVQLLASCQQAKPGKRQLSHRAHLSRGISQVLLCRTQALLLLQL